VEIVFSGEIWFWKGPAPWYFVTVPEDGCAELRSMSGAVSYGWGMIPVSAVIGRTRWTTSLFPKDGSYILPLKANVRQAEGLALGASVKVRLKVAL